MNDDFAKVMARASAVAAELERRLDEITWVKIPGVPEHPEGLAFEGRLDSFFITLMGVEDQRYAQAMVIDGQTGVVRVPPAWAWKAFEQAKNKT